MSFSQHWLSVLLLCSLANRLSIYIYLQSFILMNIARPKEKKKQMEPLEMNMIVIRRDDNMSMMIFFEKLCEMNISLLSSFFFQHFERMEKINKLMAKNNNKQLTSRRRHSIRCQKQTQIGLGVFPLHSFLFDLNWKEREGEEMPGLNHAHMHISINVRTHSVRSNLISFLISPSQIWSKSNADGKKQLELEISLSFIWSNQWMKNDTVQFISHHRQTILLLTFQSDRRGGCGLTTVLRSIPIVLRAIWSDRSKRKHSHSNVFPPSTPEVIELISHFRCEIVSISCKTSEEEEDFSLSIKAKKGFSYNRWQGRIWLVHDD